MGNVSHLPNIRYHINGYKWSQLRNSSKFPSTMVFQGDGFMGWDDPHPFLGIHWRWRHWVDQSGGVPGAVNTQVDPFDFTFSAFHLLRSAEKVSMKSVQDPFFFIGKSTINRRSLFFRHTIEVVG